MMRINSLHLRVAKILAINQINELFILTNQNYKNFIINNHKYKIYFLPFCHFNLLKKKQNVKLRGIIRKGIRFIRLRQLSGSHLNVIVFKI